MTASFRVALRRSGMPEVRAEVDRWEAAHQSPDAGPAWNNVAAGLIDHDTKTLGERVERVRKALPPDLG
jgi:hypothetical protein